MPPKPKFTRDEIAATAFQMIKEGGVSSLTARDLGARMGTSARPIFTLFKNMAEVKQAARALAVQDFLRTVADYRQYTPAFKRIGMQIVSCGIHEPEMFKLLFLQEHPKGMPFEQSMQDMGGVDETCIALVMEDYGLTQEQSKLLFEQMWTQALGLGTLCAMGVCDLTQEEIGMRLGVSFSALLTYLQAGGLSDPVVIPRKESPEEER